MYFFFATLIINPISASIRSSRITDVGKGKLFTRANSFSLALLLFRLLVIIVTEARHSKCTLLRAPRISPRALLLSAPYPAYVPSVSSPLGVCSSRFLSYPPNMDGEGHLLALSLRTDVDRARVRP